MNATAAAFLAIPEGILLGLICAGAGRRLCGLLLPEATPLERSVLGFPAGLGLLSLFTTALLFSGAPHGVLLAGVGLLLAAGAAWGGKEAVGLLRDLKGFARAHPLPAALIAASALAGLVGCMAPETGWDTGVYHFAMARLRAEQGGMIVRMDVPHGYRPAYLESLHTVGFLLNGETLASLVNLMFYLAGVALARLWGVKLCGVQGGLFAALAWMTSLTYVLRMDGGDVEVAQAVSFGVAMYALVRLREGPASRWRILGGASLGFFLGLKYSSISICAVLAATWLVVRLLDRRSWRDVLLDGAVLGFLGLAIASPWYIRNKLATGSPFFPYVASAPAAGSVSAEALSETGGGRVILQSLALDSLVFVGVLSCFLGMAGRFRWIAFPGILAAGFLWWQGDKSSAGFANAMRYASAAWVPLLALAGGGLSVLAARGGAARYGALGVLIGALAVGQGVLAKRNLPKLPAALGVQDRDSYLAGKVGTYAAIRAAEAGLKPGRKILLVEERCYYCRAPFLGASDIQQQVQFDSMKTAADLRRFLDEQSIGAIVVDRSPTAKIWRFRNLERRLGNDWPPSGVRSVPLNDGSSLYRVE